MQTWNDIYAFSPRMFDNILGLLLAFVLSMFLRFHFRFFGTGYSSNKDTGDIIPMLTLIVTLIISLIQSSLTLSLGMLGALSIVRFRTPIKEVEELTYLFMAIAIGIGIGAGQLMITTSAVFFILLIYGIFRYLNPRHNFPNLFLCVESSTSNDFVLPQNISEILKKAEIPHILKRFDSSDQGMFCTFHLDSKKTGEELNSFITGLIEKCPSLKISLVDQGRLD